MILANILFALIPFSISIVAVVLVVLAVKKNFAYHEKEIELLTQILNASKSDNSN